MTRFKRNGNLKLNAGTIKTILLLFLAVYQSIGTLFGQEPPEPIRLVFNQYATKEAGQDWSDWKSGQNVFILFYNDNGDLVHYKSGG